VTVESELAETLFIHGQSRPALAECEACRLGDDRHEQARWVYELATARGRVSVCDRHADLMRGWAGTLSQIVP